MIEISSDTDFKKVFEEIYFTHLHKVQFYAYNYINDLDSAKSIANEVFTSVWINRAKIDFSRDMLPYLIVVTRNRCLNHIKKQKSERDYINYTKITITESELNSLSLEHPSSTTLYTKEIYQILEESLNLMPDKIKSTFRLSRFENLKYEDIAKIDNVAVKTIEYRMSLALRILRKKFRDYIPLFLGYIVSLLC